VCFGFLSISFRQSGISFSSFITAVCEVSYIYENVSFLMQSFQKKIHEDFAEFQTSNPSSFDREEILRSAGLMRIRRLKCQSVFKIRIMPPWLVKIDVHIGVSNGSSII
jgi:hypothetical protein